MIKIQVSGSSKNTESFLKKASSTNLVAILQQAGRDGVAALRSATPVDSGLTAQLWDYKIERTKNGVLLTWINSSINNGFPVAIMLQYGYATGTGGYVEGKNYINPAIKPVFDNISERVWREVRNG